MEKVLLAVGVSLIAAGLIWGLTSGPQTRTETYYQVGTASWYGPKFHGQLTANGEVYDMNKMTAAHKSLPFNTRVKVVDLKTGRQVEVRINDRGPFIKNRIIDLSRRAAEKLGMIQPGTTKVGLKILQWGRS